MASADQVLGLLVTRFATVMGVPAEQITAETRFDEDLHADSLDLVEVVEGVERDLREGGDPAALGDDELLGLQTVGEAAAAIAASTAGEQA